MNVRRALILVTSPLRFDNMVKYCASEAAGSVDLCSTACTTGQGQTA